MVFPEIAGFSNLLCNSETNAILVFKLLFEIVNENELRTMLSPLTDRKGCAADTLTVSPNEKGMVG